VQAAGDVHDTFARLVLVRIGEETGWIVQVAPAATRDADSATRITATNTTTNREVTLPQRVPTTSIYNPRGTEAGFYLRNG
jgi:hypothetical protein